MFTPPDTDQARQAWGTGRTDALGNRPRNRTAYSDRALRAMYRQGYAWGRQESLQAKYGDPPTS